MLFGKKFVLIKLVLLIQNIKQVKKKKRKENYRQIFQLIPSGMINKQQVFIQILKQY